MTSYKDCPFSLSGAIAALHHYEGILNRLYGEEQDRSNKLATLTSAVDVNMSAPPYEQVEGKLLVKQALLGLNSEIVDSIADTFYKIVANDDRVFIFHLLRNDDDDDDGYSIGFAVGEYYGSVLKWEYDNTEVTENVIANIRVLKCNLSTSLNVYTPYDVVNYKTDNVQNVVITCNLATGTENNAVTGVGDDSEDGIINNSLVVIKLATDNDKFSFDETTVTSKRIGLTTHTNRENTICKTALIHPNDALDLDKDYQLLFIAADSDAGLCGCVVDMTKFDERVDPQSLTDDIDPTVTLTPEIEIKPNANEGQTLFSNTFSDIACSPLIKSATKADTTYCIIIAIGTDYEKNFRKAYCVLAITKTNSGLKYESTGWRVINITNVPDALNNMFNWSKAVYDKRYSEFVVTYGTSSTPKTDSDVNYKFDSVVSINMKPTFDESTMTVSFTFGFTVLSDKSISVNDTCYDEYREAVIMCMNRAVYSRLGSSWTTDNTEIKFEKESIMLRTVASDDNGKVYALGKAYAAGNCEIVYILNYDIFNEWRRGIDTQRVSLN